MRIGSDLQSIRQVKQLQAQIKEVFSFRVVGKVLVLSSTPRSYRIFDGSEVPDMDCLAVTHDTNMPRFRD
jgi:hypothetical protein